MFIVFQVLNLMRVMYAYHIRNFVEGAFLFDKSLLELHGSGIKSNLNSQLIE